MPKIVDHDQRRREIIAATWQVIARNGLNGTTMREVARASGYANGAIGHYFRDKDHLLLSAQEHIYQQTNRRAEAALARLTGIAALRALCVEILPLDEERLLEARIVVAFWERAAAFPHMAAVFERQLTTWREQFHDYLRQGRNSGEVTTATPDEAISDEMLNMLMGAQATALLLPQQNTPKRLLAVLDQALARLRD